MRTTSTRSWSPSLSTSAKSDCEVSSRVSRPAASVASSKVPSPRLRKSRLGQARGLGDVEVVLPSPSASPADTPWWPIESSMKTESRVASQASRPKRSWRWKPGVAAEGRLGDLGEGRGSGAAPSVVERGPLGHAPGAVRSAPPVHPPAAHALRPAGPGPFAHEVVAHCRARAVVASRLDLRDQELRDADGREPARKDSSSVRKRAASRFGSREGEPRTSIEARALGGQRSSAGTSEEPRKDGAREISDGFCGSPLPDERSELGEPQ